MRERNFAYDFIRAFAILLVVCIHSQGMLRDAVITEDNPYGTLHWCNALWHIIYVGVPLFVMLSGALLLGKQEPIKYFFKRRFSRILIPFLIWSVVIGFMLFYKEHHSLSGSIGWIVRSTFTKGVIGIYWYVYLIAGLYLITPLLRHIIASGGVQAAKYMAGFIFSIVIVGELFPSVSLASRFGCENLQYIGFFVLGFVIVNINVDLGQKHRGLILFIGLIALYAAGICGVLFLNNSNAIKPVRMAEAVVVFFLLSKIDYKNQAKMPLKSRVLGRAWGGVKLLSEISYGMYLTHFVIISLLLSVPSIKNMSLVVEPLILALGAFVLDAIMMLILKKIKLQKWLM